MGFRANAEAGSNLVVPPTVLPGEQPQTRCFSSSEPVWVPHSYRVLQRGRPLLPLVPVTSAQTVFIITYCTTSPTLQKHTCKHLPSVGTGLVVGDVMLRNSRRGSTSGTQVFLWRNSLNRGLVLLVRST